mmetsp:Transcript_3135/g.3682  ORF Transcript_3135/g.3682 Transcript_3135/m.3682 type:complete len:669 (-) Transcript_3135:198-2204(-)
MEGMATAAARRARGATSDLGLSELDEVSGGHTLGLVDLVAGSRETKRVDTEHLVGILVPRRSDASLDGDGLSLHGLGEDRLLIVGRLRLEELDARHGDDAPALAKLGGSLNTHGELRADTNDDALEIALLLLGDVGALEGARALVGGGAGVDNGEVLAREDERGRAGLARNRVGVGSGRLLGIARAHHVEVGHGAEAGDDLNGLVGRAVLADADRIVGPDVRDGKVRESGDADGAHHVAREDKEGGARGAVKAVEANAVEDGAHGVLADAVVEVAASIVVLGEVTDALEVVLVGAVEVGRAREVERHRLSNGLDDLGAGVAGGDGLARGKLGHHGHDIGRVAGDGVLELLRLLGVGGLPLAKGLLPLVVLGDELLLVLGEEVIRLGGDVELLLGEAERLAGGVLVLDAGLAVSGAGAGDLVDALADDSLAHDERRLAIVRLLGVAVRLGDGVHVVAVDLEHLPSLRLEAHVDVLRLGVIGHLVQGDAVGVVHQDEVVELLMTRKSNGLVGDALLQAAVTAEDDDVVVDDGVVGGVEGGGGVLGRSGHADAVADALAERTGRRLHTRRPAKLGVAGRLGVLGAEVHHLLLGQVVARHVKPGVEEHGAVAGREHEAVAVDPRRVIRVVGELLAEEDGANLGAAERQAHVARVRLGDGVDGEAARLIGGLC